MRRYVAFAALMFAVLIAGATKAQAQSALLNLPRASQHARVMQRVGITDITIDYHRPLVKDRKIFGGLEAYGKVWRAGANENTIIKFSDPVTIDGHALPKGEYGLHMIPGESSWVVIFSKNASSWGSFTYDAAEDALRVTVKPRTIDKQEALTYEFDDPEANSTVVAMKWDKTEVPFKVEVNTPEIVEKSLQEQLRGRGKYEWQAWQEAADYLLNNKLSAEEAVKDADASIEIEDRFENEVTKARALNTLGRKENALAIQNKALAMGNQQQVHDYGRGLQAQGHYDDALDIFRSNIKKDPNSWIAHNESARIAVAKADFDTAVKEMKLAQAAAPENFKGPISDIVKRLESKVDINK